MVHRRAERRQWVLTPHLRARTSVWRGPLDFPPRTFVCRVFLQ